MNPYTGSLIIFLLFVKQHWFYAGKFIQLFPKKGKKSFIYSTPLIF